MYTSLARLWGYTSLAAIVIIGTANLNISFAGGDPSIKDKKVYQTKSNIKQHNHSSTYKTQNKKEILKKSNNVLRVICHTDSHSITLFYSRIF